MKWGPNVFRTVLLILNSLPTCVITFLISNPAESLNPSLRFHLLLFGVILTQKEINSFWYNISWKEWYYENWQGTFFFSYQKVEKTFWYWRSPKSTWCLLFFFFIPGPQGVTHCVKSFHIRSFFWSIFSCIQSEYRKIRTRKNSVFGLFSLFTQWLFTTSFIFSIIIRGCQILI